MWWDVVGCVLGSKRGRRTFDVVVVVEVLYSSRTQGTGMLISSSLQFNHFAQPHDT
jgi:hypothetical protein